MSFSCLEKEFLARKSAWHYLRGLMTILSTSRAVGRIIEESKYAFYSCHRFLKSSRGCVEHSTRGTESHLLQRGWRTWKLGQ